MTNVKLNDMTDEELVEYFYNWALIQYESFADVDEDNRIDKNKLMPCFVILAARGKQSVRKLAALASDPNPNVQLNVAVYAFEAEPDVCRHVLLEMTKRPDVFAVFAWAALSRLDPEAAPHTGALLKNFEDVDKKVE